MKHALGCVRTRRRPPARRGGPPSAGSAARALEIGLLNAIVKPGDLLATALETADAIAANAPLAVRETRRGVRALSGLSLEEAYRVQEEIGRELRKTEDAREAQRAFVEKRRPRFTGR